MHPILGCHTPATLRSICISTTSPSIISLSSFIRTPIDLLNAWVRASVLDISNEKISDDASEVNGTSDPKDCAIPIAIAVFPVLGGPAIRTALPAILPSLTICKMTAAAFLAFSCPTRPWEEGLGSSVSSSTPNPCMWEWAATKLKPRKSLPSATVEIALDESSVLVYFIISGIYLPPPYLETNVFVSSQREPCCCR